MEPLKIKIRKFFDDRGYFCGTYTKNFLENEYSIKTNFLEDCYSVSKKNVVRGLHYQWDKPLDKLIMVTRGSILDVIVDIRKNSKNYGNIIYNFMDEANEEMLYVPAGFAHGFIALQENTYLHYKYSEYYNKDGESGIHPFDENLNINWGLDIKDCIISKRDLNFESFIKYSKNPKF